MIKSINATTPKYSKTNKSFMNQKITPLTPVSFSANICKAPKTKSRIISILSRICEEIGEDVSRLVYRMGKKIDHKFGRVPEESKELVAKIKQILGDDQEVHITKRTVLTMDPTLSPKEIIDTCLNDNFPKNVRENNARILIDIANNDGLPIVGKPVISVTPSLTEEEFKRGEEILKNQGKKYKYIDGMAVDDCD